MQAVMGLAAAAMMFVVVREARGLPTLDQGIRGRLGETLSTHRGIYMHAGPPIISLGVLRQARQVFLPLWGEQIGLGPGQIGLITSASFFIDATIFYPIGIIMDTRGRKWVAVPCLITMAVGLAILPLTNTFTTFLLVGMLLGLGNGFGSGINMTLGADFSPDVGRGEFLGVWRLISDIGQGWRTDRDQRRGGTRDPRRRLCGHGRHRRAGRGAHGPHDAGAPEAATSARQAGLRHRPAALSLVRPPQDGWRCA